MPCRTRRTLSVSRLYFVWLSFKILFQFSYFFWKSKKDAKNILTICFKAKVKRCKRRRIFKQTLTHHAANHKSAVMSSADNELEENEYDEGRRKCHPDCCYKSYDGRNHKRFLPTYSKKNKYETSFWWIYWTKDGLFGMIWSCLYS